MAGGAVGGAGGAVGGAGGAVGGPHAADVVRHGQAEPKKGWTGADADRPLVARGLVVTAHFSCAPTGR